MPVDGTEYACPFCRKPVTEELLRLGGVCPSCLIEIPGEEAPTDPTAEVARKQAEREAVERRRRRRVRLAASSAVLVGAVAGAVAWWMNRPEPPPAVSYDFEFEILPLEVHKDPDYTGLAAELAGGAAGGPAERDASSRRSSSPRRRGSARHRAESASGGTRAGGSASTARAASSLPAPESSPGADLVDTPLEAFAVPVALASRGPKSIVLSDPEQISEMIGRVLARGQKQIQRCYEARLNQVPDLSGTWLVDFTVGTQRHAEDVMVQPLDRPDPELERCIQRAVERWEFLPVKEPVPSGTKYRFTPRG